MNEARRIAACIRSAQFADQVIVVDSGSTDDTCAIAKELGAEVHVHADWQGFAQQRNHLLRYTTSDYVFFLDADEEIPPALATEIIRVVQAGQAGCWRIRWRQIVFGHTLSRMRCSPGPIRLFQTQNVLHFEGVVHEHALLRDPQTPVKHLVTPMLHYTRDSIVGSIHKLAQYTALGAAKRKGRRGGVWRGVFAGVAGFLRIYVFGRAILCGGPGFLLAVFVGLESFFRYVALAYDTDQDVRDTRRRG